MVPESNHPKPTDFETASPLRVICRAIGMTATVDLDNEPVLDAAEVHGEAPNNVLAPELSRGQLASAQMPPEKRFGVRLVVPKDTRTRCAIGVIHPRMMLWRCASRNGCKESIARPHPDPLPPSVIPNVAGEGVSRESPLPPPIESSAVGEG